MEQLISVRELFKNTEAYAGKTVSVGGWVRSVRASKAFGFIVLSDGTYFQPVQVVYHDTMENFAEISKTNVGAALIVRGTLTLTPEAKQPFEIQADEVVVEGASTPESAIPWSTCGPSPICGPGPTPSRPCSASAPWWPTPSTSSSRSAISSTLTRP